MNIIKNIAVVGDSILKGVVFDELSGKYKFLKQNAANLFSQTNNIEVANHSKFGCTTKKAIDLLPSLLKKASLSDIILLELGGNDCDFNWDEVCKSPLQKHSPKVLFEQYKKNIEHIVEEILEKGKRPVLMTLPPIDAERYFNWITQNCQEKAKNLLTFLGDKSLIYRHQELYSGALEKIANKYSLFLVNAREKLLTVHKYSDYLCLDGIHLNQKGQDFMKQIFDNTYQEYKLALN